MNAAYSISAPDIDVRYFGAAPATLFCPVCDGCSADRWYVPRLKLGQCRYDFCHTLDSRLLLSTRARTFLDEHCTTPLKYGLVDRAAGYYAADIGPVVTFDSDRRKTRFENKCERCGQYETIVGATPVFLVNAEKIESTGAYRTDLCFGSGREKNPVVIVGGALKLGLHNSFPELDFREVNEAPP